MKRKRTRGIKRKGSGEKEKRTRDRKGVESGLFWRLPHTNQPFNIETSERRCLKYEHGMKRRYRLLGQVKDGDNASGKTKTLKLSNPNSHLKQRSHDHQPQA